MQGPSLETEARALVAELGNGKFDHPTITFDAKMTAAAPPPVLAKIWQQLEAQNGKLRAVEGTTLEAKGPYRVATVLAAFERSKVKLHVAYDGDGHVAGITHESGADWAPPAYADHSAFTERAVTVGMLPGTLTLPKAPGSFPAIVLLHGSGPVDRDETVGGAKVFKDLAWGLATKGIAVLRYEKRSRHAPAGIVTVKDEVEDAAHDALALLRTRPEIDPARLWLAGHSQGGQLAPRIAATEPKLAGIVILAGLARPLEDALVDQLGYFAKTDPQLGPQVEAAKAFKARVESPELSADDDVPFPVGGAKLKGAYFLDLRGYDAPATAARLGKPVLLVQGERDYQVTSADLELWKKGLGPKATVYTYPALNHLLVAGKGTPGPAEYALPGHVDAAVVTDVAAFVKR